jgi:hypothetical protein
MAQLRDAVTSELLGEGSPATMVLLAEQLGRDDVVFDGVESEHNLGTFDPDAVIAAYRAETDGLAAVAAATTDPDVKAEIQQTIAAHAEIEQLATELVAGASEAMEQARARVQE